MHCLKTNKQNPQKTETLFLIFRNETLQDPKRRAFFALPLVPRLVLFFLGILNSELKFHS